MTKNIFMKNRHWINGASTKIQFIKFSDISIDLKMKPYIYGRSRTRVKLENLHFQLQMDEFVFFSRKFATMMINPIRALVLADNSTKY